ncbi:protein Wnt-7b-like isoform X1 [Acropora muricata]|uniref:protein Wnt-7b-like isoform X1 n=1 Tax=Acropora millepora TaxID=45264 RepID=UPI0010FCD703|nr:protein Wnt-7b-like isoform X1 [Acropora millepora]
MGICQAIVTIGLLLATVIANHLMKANKLFVVSSVATEIRPSMICSRIPGLSPKQKNICEEHPELINCIREGYQKGADECKFQFRKNRWNCSLLGQISAFDDRAIPGTKEAAFTQAITSAGVVYTISRACSMGNLSECHCDRKWIGKESKRGWSWGGCSVDINYGINLSSRFVNARRNRHDDIFLMDRHNSKAGRQVVKEKLVLQCKCHGISGACSTRTCWKTLPILRVIGKRLKELYHSAIRVEVMMTDTKGGPIPEYLVLASNKTKKPDFPSLAYMRELNDYMYCMRNETMGILGTKNRICNITGHGKARCNSLCCGRGYDTHNFTEKSQCKCKFHWCCEVKCKTCVQNVVKHTCK